MFRPTDRIKREARRQTTGDQQTFLSENQAVDLDDLAGRFAVSKMTIHRDLGFTGTVRRTARGVRGGATIDAGTQSESDFRFRERQCTAKPS